MVLADRFLRCSGCWIDLATAGVVMVAVRQAGSRRSQIAWAEHCAMLSMLRHPLLNPLIDFGVAGAASLFEVYAPRAPIVTSQSAARLLVTHGMRFLEAHGVTIPASQAPWILREVSGKAPPAAARVRPVGIVLQPRRAMDMVLELLARRSTPGMTAVRVAAAKGMGLRTLWMETARRARIEGYVPICPEALERWP